MLYSLDATGALQKIGDYHLHQSAQGHIPKASLNADPSQALAVGYTYTSASQGVFKRDARLPTTPPG